MPPNRPPPRLCSHCQVARAVLKRPKNHEQLCRDCFYSVFEEEVHHTIISQKLFKRGERIAIAASGGKDSTVLAHTLTTLNKRYDYGLDLFLLSIDEGITGYRDDSLETVKRNEATYGIPLLVVSYQQLYGWTMDEIVGQIGTRNNCTFCGVFRRQALDRGAVIAKANKIATGHNADDVAETVLLNLLRGDVARLSRCASAITGGDELGGLTRVKPFKYSYEKEIVMYAYFKRLDYFSTECIYAPFAARGYARDFVKDLEAARPTAILDLIRSAENFRFPSQQRPPAEPDAASTCSGCSNTSAPKTNRPSPRQCERCGYISSQRVCKSCVLLEGLNKGRPGGLAPTLPRTHADFNPPLPSASSEAAAAAAAAAAAMAARPTAAASVIPVAQCIGNNMTAGPEGKPLVATCVPFISAAAAASTTITAPITHGTAAAGASAEAADGTGASCPSPIAELAASGVHHPLQGEESSPQSGIQQRQQQQELQESQQQECHQPLQANPQHHSSTSGSVDHGLVLHAVQEHQGGALDPSSKGADHGSAEPLFTQTQRPPLTAGGGGGAGRARPVVIEYE